MSITEGKTVSIEYTLKLQNDEVVDTNVGGEPLTYVHGSNQIIPGLEKEIEGLEKGDERKVEVKPEEGYGPTIPEAVIEVEKTQLPQELQQTGARVQSQSPDGQTLRGRVTELKESTATIDFNHPLAGETLYFDVKVVDVQ